MKIVVFADFHGSVTALDLATQIAKAEQAQKTVVCGDLFGSWVNNADQIATLASNLPGVVYLVRGNNDRPSDELFLTTPMEDTAIMHHFGRTLFFAHGHRHNSLNLPPILGNGDVFVYGHSHVAGIGSANGVVLVNVGSLARPRDGFASYVVLDEDGITAKLLDGSTLYHQNWK